MQSVDLCDCLVVIDESLLAETSKSFRVFDFAARDDFSFSALALITRRDGFCGESKRAVSILGTDA
jgi:hypothetical protein